MNSEQITIPIEMEITKTMLTLASYDLISVNGKEKQNLSRVVCSFAGGVVVVGVLLRGEWSIFFCWHVKNFFLLHCVSLYVCRLCINYQDLRTNLLGMAALRILLLTFTSRFVIGFLSIRKVIIFSAIATDDRHPLRSRSIH